MNLHGLTDSPVSVSDKARACERCGSVARIANGSCVNCLLQPALEGHGSDGDTFAAALTGIDIRDVDWRLGNYQILEEIGRGGMGVIYRARQRHSRRIVALKRILSHHADSQETLSRFRRETEAAASLDHPNILPIHEVGEGGDGLPFFSMKYATGGSLLEAKGVLRNDPRRCVGLMAKVSRAVQHAHNQGILHRDLKPGNIMLDSRDEPLVSDFGLAKWLDDSGDLTRTLTIFGTPGYIAPEQAEKCAANLTPAADVYSLGAILFDLLTGRPPFLGEHALAVIKQASEKSAPKLRSLAPALDRDLETICAKCLEREPQARYQSADALVDDLERWLAGRPIVARPVLPPVRTWRWSKRNPKLATATIAALVFATAVIFLLLSQRSPPRPALPAKSIAVLPFQNLSDEGNVYFTEGIQDEVLTSLANIANLKVISRTSVMQYEPGTSRDARAIGQTLGVNYLVEGSVQRASGKVRVNAQLINARNDAHVWAHTYDGDLADVFAIQSQIAKAIANALETKLSPREKAAIEQAPTIDVGAFDLYSHAKALNLSFTPTAAHRHILLQAADLLNKAVARDPSFFQAHCRLVDAYTELYLLGIDRSPERLVLAQKELDAAFRLQPDAGEAHLARAIYLYRVALDYDGALRELQNARETLPNSPGVFELTGYIRRRQGYVEDGLQNLKRSLELDPRNIRTLHQIAISYYGMRRYSDAIAVLDRSLAIKPDEIGTRVARASVELDWKGDTRPMRRVIDSIRKNDPAKLPSTADNWLMAALAERNPSDAETALGALGDGTFGTMWVQLNRRFGEGLVARMTKDDARAHAAFTAARVEQEKVVKAEPDYGPAWCGLGLIDAGLGKKEEALREGRHAIELLPMPKDALNGTHMIEYFAVIAAWVGEKGLACEQLEKTTRISGGWINSYGELKLSPAWDPLRGDPRFEKIVASLAPTSLLQEPPGATSKSIAVLPFQNLSEDKANTYFAEGIQGEILKALAAMRELKVISRSSSAKYQSRPENLGAVARELGVAMVLEGAVQKSGDKVRVNVQLIDARNDTQLWASSYDRELKDLFTVESEVAEEIAEALKANLSPSEVHALASGRTQDAEAYDLFLRAEYEFHQAESSLVAADFDRADAFYRQAIVHDPNFVGAAAGLAYSRLYRHWFTSRLTHRELEQMRSLIDRALAVAPDSPEAHFALGIFFYWGQRRYPEALAEFKRTLQLQPNNALARQYCAWVCRRRGEWERSIGDAQQAEQLDPRDASIPMNLGITYSLLRQWKNAKQVQVRALAIDPHNVIAAMILAMTQLNATGDIPAARRAFGGIPPGLRTSSPSVHGDVTDIIGVRVYLDVIERRFPDALQTLENEAPNGDRSQLLAGRVALGVLAGENEAARSDAEQALPLLETRLKEVADDTFAMTELAWVYLALGRNNDALHVARQAADLISVQRDTVSGPFFQTGLAQIQARAGAPGEAVNSLRHLMSIPAGQWISLARLRIDPVWDPLRNHADFQQLLSGKELIWPNK